MFLLVIAKLRTILELPDTDNNPDNYKFIQLECDNDLYATIEELKEGGLAEYLGDMEENRRKNLQDG